ncbi:MAG TPA: carboxypeptidase regulatory-like domain-containing protein [Bryobacteraceae bacterium]|nr:carboxypeptidase regulatory-like domain-containing protein [Bryobacteraceae bacterium]
MRSVVALLALAGVILAQNPQPPQGSISGVVRDESTGKPMAGVDIEASRPAATAVTTKTDAEGRYTLSGLDPGSYRVIARTRPGGPVGIPMFASRPVTLQGGQDVTGIDILLRPSGEISGKVVDGNGEPLAGIRVFLVAKEYSSGALRLVLGGGGTSDDQGNYTMVGRIEGGRAYLLLAQKRQMQLPAVSDAPDDPRLRRPALLPTYHPDAGTPEQAQALVLRVGERRENVDIRMRKTPSYCIESVLTGPTGPDGLTFRIGLQQPTNGASGSGAFYAGDPGGPLGPRGEVRICDLPPGEYDLTVEERPAAGTDARSPELFERARITVTDRDVVGFRLAARPGMEVPGEVAWHGPAPDKPVEATLSLELRSITRTIRHSAKSTIPGQFSLPGMPLDEYSVSIRGLPDGIYLKDLTYAGHSILGKSLRAGSAMGEAALRILVARDGSFVNARVTDRDGNPVGNCYVHLLPAGVGSEAELAALMQSEQTDQYGAWKSGALAPGKYYVLATYGAVDKSPEDIGKLWRARLRAQEVTLGPSATAQVKLEPQALE